MAEKTEPQPQSISFEQFTEAVTTSVLRAIQAHVATTNSPEWRNPRIIIGIIAEPKVDTLIKG
jgi:hypothetical protein